MLVLALGGTATAAKLITGKQIENNSLTDKDIKNKSVQSADLSAGAKTALKGTKGDTGAAGAPGVASAAGVRGDEGDAGAPGVAGPASGWSGKMTGLTTTVNDTDYGYLNSPDSADGDVPARSRHHGMDAPAAANAIFATTLERP